MTKKKAKREYKDSDLIVGFTGDSEAPLSICFRWEDGSYLCAALTIETAVAVANKLMERATFLDPGTVVKLIGSSIQELKESVGMPTHASKMDSIGGSA